MVYYAAVSPAYVQNRPFTWDKYIHCAQYCIQIIENQTEVFAKEEISCVCPDTLSLYNLQHIPDCLNGPVYFVHISAESPAQQAPWLRPALNYFKNKPVFMKQNACLPV